MVSVSIGTAAGSSAGTVAALLADVGAVVIAVAAVAMAGSAGMWAPVEVAAVCKEAPTGCAAVGKEAETAGTGAAAVAGLFRGAVEAGLLEGCLAPVMASELSSKPGAS